MNGDAGVGLGVSDLKQSADLMSVLRDWAFAPWVHSYYDDKIYWFIVRPTRTCPRADAGGFPAKKIRRCEAH